MSKATVATHYRFDGIFSDNNIYPSPTTKHHANSEHSTAYSRIVVAPFLQLFVFIDYVSHMDIRQT